MVFSYLRPLSRHPDHPGGTAGQGAGPHLLGPLVVAAPGLISGLRVHPVVEVHPVT